MFKQKCFFILTALEISIFYIIFFIFIYPNQKKVLENNEIEKIRLLSNIYSKYIKVYLETNDDISLLQTLKEIASTPEISYAQLIDPSGKIVAHNDIHKWNKNLHFCIDRKIVTSDLPVLCPAVKHSSYNYFLPIKLSEEKKIFLSMNIKSNKLSENERELKKQTALYFGILLLSMIVLNVTFFFITILAPIKKINKLLNSLILGKPGEKIVYDNKDKLFSKMCDLINKVIDKYTNLTILNKNDKSFFHGICLIAELLGEITEYGLIITDSKNSIRYINKKAKKILNFSEMDVNGMHIIEILKNKSGFIEFYKDCLENSQATVEKFFPEQGIMAKGRNKILEDGSNMVVLLLEEKLSEPSGKEKI